MSCDYRMLQLSIAHAQTFSSIPGTRYIPYEERSKQGQTNKQGKATQHTQDMYSVPAWKGGSLFMRFVV